MKKIEYDETISAFMLGVGAFSELDENGTAKKQPEFIKFMALSITTSLAYAIRHFEPENPDDLEMMRGLLAFIAGNPVIERIFNLIEKNLDEQIENDTYEFIKDADMKKFIGVDVEGLKNGSKPS